MRTTVKIREIAADRKMKHAAIARQVGVSPSHLSTIILNHRKTIRLDLIGRLCAALNCTPNDLFEIRADNVEGSQ